MLKKLICLGQTLFLAACISGVPDGKISPATSPMPQGEKVRPPNGFNIYCEQRPTACMLPDSHEFQSVLNKAFSQTKALVIPEAEKGTDIWQDLETPGPGDCEDFALTLRKILRELYPQYSQAFLVATAFTDKNQYHAVLSIETRQGTIVCDNLSNECAPWEQYPYDWKFREVAGKDYWRQIGPTNTFDTKIATASGP